MRGQAACGSKTGLLSQVELRGWGHQGDSMVGFLGYCPQENVLWPCLTVREHLEVFTAIKGLRKGDATVAISR